MIMEAQHSESTWFLTLTYNPENLPHDPESFTPCLRPKDVQLYLKRLRATRGGGLTFRYFLCGEYGDRTLRPHYHAILFFSPSNPAPADLETTIDRYWGKGHTLLGAAEPASFDYVSQYVMKKSADTSNHPVPEFQRMSTNPALGSQYIDTLAEKYLESGALQNDLEKHEDVINCFRSNGQVWPIDPYMRNKLRDRLGVPRTRADRQEGLSLEATLIRNWTEQPTEQDINKSRSFTDRTIRRLQLGRMGRTL